LNTGTFWLALNGEGDLTVMSIDAFEKRERALEIREKLQEHRQPLPV